jgi:hypothetical protein
MLQLKNNTPFSASIALFPNEQGIDTLYTIVKASFNIGRQWTLVEEQLEPQKEDVFWGEPTESSLRFASDFHTGKAATDILMVGSACAPDQQYARQINVSLMLGNLTKTIRVIGDRCWDQGRMSSPEPFTEMPLVYERAFGGKDLVEGQLRAAEVRNPVGAGFAGKRKASEMNGMELPNLENPQQLIQDFQDTPTPVCFAPVAPSWQPRVTYAGTYDEQWQKHRAPYLPDDYNHRFMNCATPDLIYSEFLRGGEPVKITGMHPSGELNFTLPQVNLRNKIQVAGKEVPGDFFMESVILDPNKLQLSLVWRSAFVCDKKLTQLEQVSVNLVR